MISKKRIRLLIFGLFLPLLIGILIVYFLYSKFGYLLFPTIKNNSSNTLSYIEPVNINSNDLLKIGEIEKPKEKVVEKKESVKAVNTTKNTNWWEYPKKTYITKRSGNDLHVLVDKTYRLPSTYKPGDLVDVKSSGIRTKNNLSNTYFVRKILINDLKEMNNAAKKDGIDISVVSAYRSYSTQVSTYNYWISVNNGCVSCADKISARAGHSQHQLGTAIDFSSKEVSDGLGGRFYTTKASSWLAKNGYKYGFVIAYPSGYENITGYSYEAWHYRYIGKEYAKEMKDSGKILEKYLIRKN